MKTFPTVTIPRWMPIVLWTAAVYNLVWGAFVVLFPAAPFAWAGLPAPNYPSIVQCLAMVIGVYGVGYAIAARDPARHWAIVLVGLLGKVFGPIGFVWTALQGELPWSAGWMIVANDLLWWLPFTAMLVYAAKVHGETAGPAIGTFREELERARIGTGESLWELSQQERLLVVFVRHAGCTFCREAVHDVGEQAESLQTAGVRPIIVHMGKPEEAKSLWDWSRNRNLDAVSDPDRRLFREFELRMGNLWQLAGPYVFWRAIFGGTLFKYGFGKMIGHGMQLAGVFLVDRGRIVTSYRHQSTADRPDYAKIACERSETFAGV